MLRRTNDGARPHRVVGGTFDRFHVGHMAAAAGGTLRAAAGRGVLLTSHVPRIGRSTRRRRSSIDLRWQRWRGRRARLRGGRHRAARARAIVHGGDAGSGFTRAGYTRIAAFLHHGRRRLRRNCNLARLSARSSTLAHFVVVSTGQGRSVTSMRERPAGARGDGCGTSAKLMDACRSKSGRPSIFLVNAPTPNVSSTRDPRALAAARQPINGLVPPAVERHIDRHALYAPMRGASPAAAHSGRRACCMSKSISRRATPHRAGLPAQVLAAVTRRSRQEGRETHRAGPPEGGRVHRLLRDLHRAERAADQGDRGSGGRGAREAIT